MRAERMAAFLRGVLTGSDLEAEIYVELRDWMRAMGERGRAAHIHLDPTSFRFEIAPVHMRHLLIEVMEERLSPAAAAYFVDAALLGDAFSVSDEDVRDGLERLSEIQHKGKISLEAARDVLASLDDCAEP